MRYGLYLLLLMTCWVHAKPLRVISLSPHLTELVYAIGAEDELVGVIDRSDYPKAARKITVIGDYQRLNIEKILALKPDLILSWSQGNPSAQLETLKQFGIATFDSAPTRLAQLPDFIKRLGIRLHHPMQAEQLANRLSIRLKSLQHNYQHRSKVRVFYQVWHQPLMTVASGSWINDAINLCGGENIFEQNSAPYPQVNIEQVMARNPQAIVIADHHHQGAQIWRKWPQLKATEQIIWLNPDEINRFTPRLVNAVETLCHALDHVRKSL